MPTISLDEIIHYRPPTEKAQFRGPRPISLYPQNYSNPSSEGPILSRPFPPSQVWPSGFPLSAHERCPQMISRSPVEPGPSLPLTEHAGEVALDLSEEMGMDFPNVTLEEDTDGPLSNAHWSRSDLLNCFDGSLDYRWRQGTHVSPLQHPGESNSVKDPSASSLASPGDEPFPAAEAKERENKTSPSIFADSAKVEDRILQDSGTSAPATPKEDLNVTSSEHSLNFPDKRNPDSSFGLLSDDVSSPTGDVEVGPDELRVKSPVCSNSEEITPEECGGHLISERCESVQAEANEAEVIDAENELSHTEIEIPSTLCEPYRIHSSGRRSCTMSLRSQRGEDQSKCNRTDKDANLPSVSKLQSVVITNSRFRERDMRKFAPSAPNSHPKRKRGISVSSRDGSCSDNSSDADDADDVSESSILSKGAKRVRRAAVQSSPAHLRHKKNTRHSLPSQRCVSRASKNEGSHPQMPRDRHPVSSLSGIETIPIRGFLTREILLSKVVYSITFEERTEHTCLQAPDETPPGCERKAQRRKLPLQKNHQVGKSIRPTRILSKDDELLIELKEEKGFKWKKIGEYFPNRSVGSLQVRYSTRLKSRSGRSDGLSATNIKSKATEPSLRQRYGPPRRRQTVDRYCPV